MVINLKREAKAMVPRRIWGIPPRAKLERRLLNSSDVEK